MDNNCTVKQASELGWNKDERVLEYRGRTISSIEDASPHGYHVVNYDCGQMDILPGDTRLDIYVPLAVYKAAISETPDGEGTDE